MAVNVIRRTVALDGPITPETFIGNLYVSEDDSHQFIISATQGGEDYPLSGTVSATFIRKYDNVTVPITGSTSDGKAIVTLIPNCYLYSGRFDMTIFVTASGRTTAIYNCSGYVKASGGASTIDPSSEVTLNVNSLISAINTATASVPADYSSLLAKIANTFNNYTDYKAGKYVWYNSGL